MKFLFFIIFMISNVNLVFSDGCETNAMLALNNMYFFKYEEAFNVLTKNYDKCKNDCKFLRIYNEIFSLSSEDFFNRIKESDILKQMSCDYGYYLPSGPIFYYFRKGELKELEKFDEKIVRLTLGEYIYYRYLKNGDFCNLFNIKEENIEFGSPPAAYLFFICGDLEKAKKLHQLDIIILKKKLRRRVCFIEASQTS